MSGQQFMTLQSFITQMNNQTFNNTTEIKNNNNANFTKKQQIKVRSKLDVQKKEILIHQNQQDKYLEFLVQQQINNNFQTKKCDLQRPRDIKYLELTDNKTEIKNKITFQKDINPKKTQRKISPLQISQQSKYDVKADTSISDSTEKQILIENQLKKKSIIQQLKINAALFNKNSTSVPKKYLKRQNSFDIKISTALLDTNNSQEQKVRFALDTIKNDSKNMLYQTVNHPDAQQKTFTGLTTSDQNLKSKCQSSKQLINFQKQKRKFQFPLESKINNCQNKMSMYIDFLQKVNISNNQIVMIPEDVRNYKVYIGKGNNFKLIRDAFKKRWWWQITDQYDIDQSQCVITQLKNQEFIDNLNNIDYKNLNYSDKVNHNSNNIDPNLQKLLNQNDCQNLKYIFRNFQYRFIEENVLKPIKGNIRKIQTQFGKSHNHLDKNFHISNKKALFYNIKNFCENKNEDPFEFIPITFHIINGLQDKDYLKFSEFYNMKQYSWESLPESERKSKPPKNIYIIKPGEQTNRGQGISVESDIQEIDNILSKKETHKNGNPKTYIIQVYIDRPLLYNKRKFDIRCFILVTSQNGIQKCYWFQEGYIRTSSTVFTLKNLQNKFIHLTNDAIQQKNEEYGKFEGGNKVSYKEFEKYLAQYYPSRDFQRDIIPQMKKIAKLSIQSAYGRMDPKRKDNSFELFGLDYMIDEDFKTYLIEVNTNPCLEITSTLLARLIPNMIENMLRIAIDPIYPPPDINQWNGGRKDNIPDKFMENNKFELIFDELFDAINLSQITNNKFLTDKQIYDIEEESEHDSYFD